MSPDSEFLADLMARPWVPDEHQRLKPAGLFLGNGAPAIEVAVAQCDLGAGKDRTSGNMEAPKRRTRRTGAVGRTPSRWSSPVRRFR